MACPRCQRTVGPCCILPWSQGCRACIPESTDICMLDALVKATEKQCRKRATTWPGLPASWLQAAACVLLVHIPRSLPLGHVEMFLVLACHLGKQKANRMRFQLGAVDRFSGLWANPLIQLRENSSPSTASPKRGSASTSSRARCTPPQR